MSKLEMEHLLTPAQKRANKRDEKKRALIKEIGSMQKDTKVKRKRKPMTPEQRAAASERLAVARSKRAPAKNSSVHPDVLALPEEHPVSYVKVKEWLKYNTELLSGLRSQKDSKESKQRQEFQVTEAYVKNLKIYIKDGVWLDHRFGKLMESSTSTVCLALSYAADGNVVRSIGTFYPDIGVEWTKEMEQGGSNE